METLALTAPARAHHAGFDSEGDKVMMSPEVLTNTTSLESKAVAPTSEVRKRPTLSGKKPSKTKSSSVSANTKSRGQESPESDAARIRRTEDELLVTETLAMTSLRHRRSRQTSPPAVANDMPTEKTSSHEEFAADAIESSPPIAEVHERRISPGEGREEVREAPTDVSSKRPSTPPEVQHTRTPQLSSPTQHKLSQSSPHLLRRAASLELGDVTLSPPKRRRLSPIVYIESVREEVAESVYDDDGNKLESGYASRVEDNDVSIKSKSTPVSSPLGSHISVASHTNLPTGEANHAMDADAEVTDQSLPHSVIQVEDSGASFNVLVPETQQTGPKQEEPFGGLTGQDSQQLDVVHKYIRDTAHYSSDDEARQTLLDSQLQPSHDMDMVDSVSPDQARDSLENPDGLGYMKEGKDEQDFHRPMICQIM